LRLLAEQGNVAAQWYLGLMYLDGFGYPVKRDHAEAQKWITLAAQNGNVTAQWTLGDMYRWGLDEFPEDKAEAAKWLRFAASQGDTRAQTNLGDMAFRTNEKVDKAEGAM
jgi:TPR repeat protein